MNDDCTALTLRCLYYQIIVNNASTTCNDFETNRVSALNDLRR